MLPLPVALGVGFFLLLFAVPALSFAVAVFAHLLYNLPASLRHWTSAVGWVLYAFVIGSLMLMVGSGAYEMGSDVINGIITRLTE
jgi:hypothetical protein